MVVGSVGCVCTLIRIGKLELLHGYTDQAFGLICHRLDPLSCSTHQYIPPHIARYSYHELDRALDRPCLSQPRNLQASHPSDLWKGITLLLSQQWLMHRSHGIIKPRRRGRDTTTGRNGRAKYWPRNGSARGITTRLRRYRKVMEYWESLYRYCKRFIRSLERRDCYIDHGIGSISIIKNSCRLTMFMFTNDDLRIVLWGYLHDRQWS